MKAITRDYLVDIIYRVISKTIVIHRNSRRIDNCYEDQPPVTDEEILDFIHYIPWFDEKLKDFLIGNLPDNTTIISQAWEIEFLKKAMLWAESYEWLNGDDYFLSKAHISSMRKHVVFLTLPY